MTKPFFLSRIQPAQTFVFDFNSTLIAVETLDELAEISLADSPERDERIAEISSLTQRAMSGEISLHTALHRRIELLSARREHLDILIERLRNSLTPSLIRNAAFIPIFSSRFFVLSGGFTDCIVPVLEPLGFRRENIYGNSFVFSNNGEIIGFDEQNPLAFSGGKPTLLRSLALPRPILAIGDGFSDWEIREAGEADTFLAFTEIINRPNVGSYADGILENFDSLFLQLNSII